MIAPLSSTMISSALTTVARRCAITSVVRPCATRSSAPWISRSVKESSADVASSRMRMGGSFENRACDGHPLFLAAGEFQATLANLRVIGAWRLLNEAVDLRQARSLPDLGVARAIAAIADVVGDKIIEQHSVLRNDADRRP